MSSTYGENLHLTIFGQSHSPAIGVTVEGIPAGEKVDLDELQRFLDRRAPGKNVWSTPRKEADAPEILSGLVNGYTCGAPLTAIIRNTNTRSQDYANLAVTPRPGHADYTAEVKYGGYQDRAGGGHFSGRLTAPLCIAGGICLQILAREGITVVSRIASIAGITDEGELTGSLAGKEFPVVSDARGEEMREAIAQAREAGDSVGGVIECAIFGAPAGLGDPMFGGMENRIASAVFGIPAVKGVEFGAGFGVASLRGSEDNDAFTVETARSSLRRTIAAAFSAASRTACPSCSARRSSRRHPSRASSRASICRRWCRRRWPSRAATTRASCRAPCPVWRRRPPSRSMMRIYRAKRK